MTLWDVSAIDWLEVIWTVAALATCIFSGLNWHEACRDWKTVQAEGANGLLRMWTRGMQTVSIILLVKATLLVVAGVIVLALPNPESRPWGWGGSEWLRAVFISINVLMFVTAFMLASLRHRMTAYRDSLRRKGAG